MSKSLLLLAHQPEHLEFQAGLRERFKSRKCVDVKTHELHLELLLFPEKNRRPKNVAEMLYDYDSHIALTACVVHTLPVFLSISLHTKHVGGNSSQNTLHIFTGPAKALYHSGARSMALKDSSACDDTQLLFTSHICAFFPRWWIFSRGDSTVNRLDQAADNEQGRTLLHEG